MVTGKVREMLEGLAMEGWINIKGAENTSVSGLVIGEFSITDGPKLKEALLEDVYKRTLRYLPGDKPLNKHTQEYAANRGILGHHLSKLGVPEDMIMAIMHHPDQMVQAKVDKWAKETVLAIGQGRIPGVRRRSSLHFAELSKHIN